MNNISTSGGPTFICNNELEKPHLQRNFKKAFQKQKAYNDPRMDNPEQISTPSSHKEKMNLVLKRKKRLEILEDNLGSFL